jgi:hypothetical protein
MAYCEKCKSEWKRERLLAVQAEALKIATETGTTQAIIKEGCIYKIINANEVQHQQVEEYISAG